jgi:glutamate dehydrogenase
MAAQTSSAVVAHTTSAEDAHDHGHGEDYVAEAKRLLSAEGPALTAFFTSFTRHASSEDLTQFTGAELAALVKLIFARTAKRSPGAPMVEIFNPSAEDAAFARHGPVALAVNDDIPFLYDSGTAEVRAQGLQIAAAFHPVIGLMRDGQGMRSASGTELNESVIVLLLGSALDAPRAVKLREGLQKVFADVHAVVKDWKAMLARLAETVSGLKNNPPPIPEAELNENLAFLGWLADNHFTFLGCRDYVFSPEGKGRLEARKERALGLLADPEMRVVRRGADRSSLTPDVLEFLNQPAPIIIAKSNARSTVHRHAHMDYVGVKTFDIRGNLAGERRFVGLFTSSAYSELPADIPLLRRKVSNVLARTGLPPAGHDGKALAHILDTYPRDELFQISEDELLSTALGILSLGERPKVRVFLRFDKFDRFVSALVFMPRERFNGAVRAKIHTILAKAFHGRESAATPMLDDEVLARIHYIIGRNPGPRPDRDVRELEAEIRAAIRTWEDGFAQAVEQTYGEGTGPISERYAGAFPASYRDTFSPLGAAEDIERIEQVLEGKAACGAVGAHVYGRDGDKANALHLKLFARGGFVALSDCLPVFEKLGLKVIAEDSFALTPVARDGKPAEVALQNFLMERADGKPADLERVKPLLEDAFHAVWAGRCESDGFNRLVVGAELDWRDVVILRMLAKYLRQAGLMLSQAYMESALTKNPAIAEYLVALFRALHDPELFADTASRKEHCDGIRAKIEEALNDVPSADDDRIIRAMRSIIDASLRTSFFQAATDGGPRPYIATKLDSRKLDMLPAPKPLYEIFVYSPDVEAIHLRFGRIARGGIRWSDRPEDFRTEILSLVKAQQVKNAVIVPVGAKGGFYPKRLPQGGSRDEIQAAGISAYRLFIGAILDLTDNLGPDGQVIPPKGVIRYDGDDPYLVVAADKGTATFSDIANGLAIERNYWLGDAFASGGSRGYDHKKMGITARGAWEAVKRHFRELGRDIQTEPFTCIGVGDMSGDVFGNGLLQSKETKLLAAFDHRHIFLDPSPDPHASWAERKRMFDLPRSSWADYNAALISKGGGVYPRTAKEIPLSDDVKKLTGLTKDRATPAELIRAILSVPVDLLFFGGIGTYIKASTQSHGDAGDRANDALRIDGRDVRALVVGEGANLGATQYGRIEYAREGGPERKGGRIDTDAIDNSAGVDTSDHEVNIKILMSGPLRRGSLTDEGRDSFLVKMTEDVAALVLKDNYDQTFALSVAEATAARDLDAAGRLMREMERDGLLDRAVEMLPSDDAMKALARQGLGLTRPELSVLLAYAKLELFDKVAESTLPDDPYFAHLLTEYFPKLAVQHFESEIPRHRLAREIVATQLVNRMVNLAGPLYAHRMRELSNAPLWCTARAFALADGAFGLSYLAKRIGALDLKIPARTQIAMMGDIAELLRRLGLWFIVQLPAQANVAQTVETYARAFAALKGRFAGLVSPLETKTIEARITALQQAGVPIDVAEDAGVLPLLGAAPEIVLLSEKASVPVDAAAGAYFALGAALGLDRLRALAGEIAPADHWDRLALRRTVDDLYAAQRMLAAAALKEGPALSGSATRSEGAAAVKSWAKIREEDIGRTAKFLSELGHSGEPSIAKLSLANSQIQKLAAAAQP